MISNLCMDWLKYARVDIDVAQQLFTQQCNPSHRPIEVILYHCQQGVEKALKAYLIQSNVIPPRIHDLNTLRVLCAERQPQFNEVRLIKHCTYLNTFSVQVRYPRHNMALNSAEARRGLNSAKRMFDFVLKQLGLNPRYFM